MSQLSPSVSPSVSQLLVPTTTVAEDSLGSNRSTAMAYVPLSHRSIYPSVDRSVGGSVGRSASWSHDRIATDTMAVPLPPCLPAYLPTCLPVESCLASGPAWVLFPVSCLPLGESSLV